VLKRLDAALAEDAAGQKQTETYHAAMELINARLAAAPPAGEKG
jgi:hypothetical protein